MFGYEALTHFVYVFLVTAFVAVMIFMVWYNLRMKASLKGSGAHPQSKGGEIIMERELVTTGKHRR